MITAVTGAAGRVGSRVATKLVDAGHEVLGLARDLDRVPAGVLAFEVEYDDQVSLRNAFTGVDALVFVSSDGKADVVLRHHRNVIEAARQAGVRRVVYLSSIESDLDSPFCYARTNAATEHQLFATFPDVHIVRTGLFTEFLHQVMGDEDEVRLPAARVATLSRADAADALVDALLDPNAPAIQIAADACSHSFEEIASERGQQFIPIDLHTYRARLIADRVDPWWAYAYTSMMQAIVDGRWTRDRVGDQASWPTPLGG